MTNPSVKGGSSISARDRTPSLHLSKLADLLAESIPTNQNDGAAALPFLLLDGKKLRLNTQGVLERLIRHEAFKPEFLPGQDSGFLRDIEMPPPGTRAKVGGRLLPGSEVRTSNALEKLHAAISAQLDMALEGQNLEAFVLPSMDEALEILSATVRERKPEAPAAATMVPVHFAPSGRKAEERGKDIGRMLSAIEMIDGRDWLDVLLNGISEKLRKDGIEDAEEIVGAIESQKNVPGSQIRRFLDFLDDEALSRVRLQVTMRLMEAVAAQSTKPGLKAYVARVKECFDRFAGANGESLLLDVGAAHGQHNTSDFADHLQKATFYGCLPVWAEWSVQLFESRTEPTQGFATVREVSYRFRVNGNNPQTGLSAFETRLQRIHERVLASPGPDNNVKKAIAELVFLHLVLPDSIFEPSPRDIAASAARIAEALKTDPITTLQKLFTQLQARSQVMSQIADELVKVLQSKSKGLLEVASRTVDKFKISVLRSIVNWEAVESIAPGATDILVKNDRGPDSVVWFDHLIVSDATTIPGRIASYSVHTELQERSLAPSGDAYEVEMTKDLSGAVLPVRLIPFHWDKYEQTWRPAVPNPDTLDAGTGIEVEYALRTLTLTRVKDDEKAKSEQLRTAALSAFSLLVYIALWELARRIQSACARPLSMTIVRLQLTGKKAKRDEDAQDGNTAVYAVSQALEKALSRELPVKLQGLTTQLGEREAADALRWKNRGALHALVGGHPLRFQMNGTLDRVALITYVTRPSDMHPMYPEMDGFLFINRTYQAVRENGVATLRLDRMQSRLVDSIKDFKTPQRILEEIARLSKEGFEHIMLLSHHFGNRHVGRATERHSPHGSLQFLEEASVRFPDIHLYSLRRDVFPATRLRKRGSDESAFEVVSFDDHDELCDQMGAEVLRSIVPVYTFATLAVVADEQERRPQSGFCTYFFDLEQRVSNRGRQEIFRQNMLGTGQGRDVQQSLISVLRALHFMESEKPANKSQLLPVLDPFDWAMPANTAAAGEVEIMRRHGGGRTVLLSIPAVLAHVTKVLHKEHE